MYQERKTCFQVYQSTAWEVSLCNKLNDYYVTVFRKHFKYLGILLWRKYQKSIAFFWFSAPGCFKAFPCVDLANPPAHQPFLKQTKFQGAR